MKKILPILALVLIFSSISVHRAHAMSFNDGIKILISYFKQDVRDLGHSLTGAVVKSKIVTPRETDTVKVETKTSVKNPSQSSNEKAAEFYPYGGGVDRCREVTRTRQPNGVILEVWGDFLPISHCSFGFVSPTSNTDIFPGLILSKDLYFGMRNTTDVKKPQNFLRDAGYFKGKSDGSFGLQTRTAVRSFQKGQGITATGYVDVKTRERISSIVIVLP